MTTKLSVTNLSNEALLALTGPKILSVQITDSNYNTINDTSLDINGGYVIITGSNFINTNYNSNGSTYISIPQVLLDEIPATSITFVSNSTLQVQLPAASAKTYSLQVINPDGKAAILVNGINYSPFPAWITGSTLTSAEALSPTNIQLSANEATNSAITYTLAAANTVPSNLVLYANGLISGIVSANANATYNFTVQAMDAQNQDAYKTFSLPVTLNTPPAWLSNQLANLFPVFTTNTNANAIYFSAGTPIVYSNTIVANDPYIISYTLVSGSLPPGLSLNSNTGVISGNTSYLNSGNNYSFIIKATDYAGFTANNTFNLPVYPFNATTLMLKTNSSSASSNVYEFVDSSGNNVVINRTGTPNQTQFSPFVRSGRWSIYLDGSSTLSAISELQTAFAGWGGRTRTWECWIYRNSTATDYSFQNAYDAVSANGRWAIGTSSNKLSFAWTTSTSVGTSVVSTATIPVGWAHLAVTIDSTTAASTTIYLGINGTVETFTGKNLSTQTSTYSWVNFFDTQIYQAAAFKGAFSGLRWSSNLRYTSNYNVPRTPHVDDANTLAIIGQAYNYYDESSNRYQFEPVSTAGYVGNAYVLPLTPYIPEHTPNIAVGSGYFDGGIGQYISFNQPALGNVFTLEFWVYPHSIGSSQYFYTSSTTGPLIGNDGTSLLAGQQGAWQITGSKNVILNTWNHIALVREGTETNQFKLYLNGANIGSGTSYTTYDSHTSGFGGYTGVTGVNGYFSNFRLSNNSAIYTTDFTPPDEPVTADSNTKILLNFGNFGMFDATGYNYLDQTVGANVRTTQYKWNKSIDFSGAGSYVTVANVKNLPILTSLAGNIISTTGEFTFECWYYNRDVTKYHNLWCQPQTSVYGSAIRSIGIVPSTNTPGNGIGLVAFTQGFTNIGGYLTNYVPPANTWVHLAVTRDSSGFARCWVNGTYRPTTRIQTTWLGSDYGPTLTDTYYLNQGRIGYVTNGGSGSGSTAHGETTGFIEDVRILNKALYTSNANISVPTIPHWAVY